MKQKIPQAAENEILETLNEQMHISGAQIADILKRHGVSADNEVLQYSYRRRLGQQFLASLKDEDGRRDVFAVSDGNGGIEYVVIEGCSDRNKLKRIWHRLNSQTSGLDNSAVKVKDRWDRLNAIAHRIRKAG